jgi:hypothetical protein
MQEQAPKTAGPTKPKASPSKPSPIEKGEDLPVQTELLPSVQKQTRKASSKPSMLDSQRDAVLAEVLGDVAQLSEHVQNMGKHLEQMQQSFSANDFVRWRNTIDFKLSELNNVNLSDEAAARLQAVASAYISQLAVEMNTMVAIEVKKGVADTMAFQVLFEKLNQTWLMRLLTISGVTFLSTLLANWVWNII